MARHAKILTDSQLAQFEEYVRTTSHNPIRDTAIVNLSFRVGLRAGEMAKMRWVDVMDAEGNISYDTIHVPSEIVKFSKRDREVPMHPKVRAALVAQRNQRPFDVYICNRIYNDHIIDEPIRDNTLAVYLFRLFHKAGFDQASSHSGRRTFTTKLARRANVHHCSLRDVQLLVGHSRIDTTESYIGPSDDVHSLVLGEL